MHLVEVLTKEDCHLCDEAIEILMKVQRDIPFVMKEIEFSPQDESHRKFRNDIPVVMVDGSFFCKHRIDESALRKELDQRPLP